MLNEVCHSCGAETDWQCEKCEHPVCEDCTVPFTQMNQIDYTLCNCCYDTSQEAHAQEQAEEDLFNSLEPEEQKNYYKTNSIISSIKKHLKKLGN